VEGLLNKAGDVEAIALWRKAMTGPKHLRRADADNVSIKPVDARLHPGADLLQPDLDLAEPPRIYVAAVNR